ncbi:MAG: SLBB domain-containing protein [Fimbriimonadaceae bacterium]|nr:MAG: SLBB domain-containing protein [Fimbriimonadaceae bacterium]
MLSRWIFSVMFVFCVAASWAVQSATTIKPGDTLRLICAEESDLNRDYRVTSDGLILVDFLGAVKVQGLTEAEASKKISKQLEDEKILKKATISLQLISPEVKLIKFGGESKIQGETPWKSGMTLIDLMRISELTVNTDVTRIQIKSADGKLRVVDATKPTSPDNDLSLMPGDEVTFLKKDPNNQPATNPNNPDTNPNNPVTNPVTNPGTVAQVTLAGLVALPGKYDLVANMTLRELLVRAGGFLEGARLGSISLERGASKRDLSIPADNDFALMPGDVVTVNAPERPKMFVTVDGSVNKPGRYEITEGTKLSEVIKMAGGFVEGARTDKIKIFSPANAKPREIKFEDIELGYRGDVELSQGQTIEIPGPKPNMTLDSRTKAAAGAIAFLFLLGF